MLAFRLGRSTSDGSRMALIETNDGAIPMKVNLIENGGAEKGNYLEAITKSLRTN